LKEILSIFTLVKSMQTYYNGNAVNRVKRGGILTYSKFTLDFNYFRHDGDYSDIHLYIRRAEKTSAYEYMLPLTPNNSGAGVVYEFGAIEDVQSAVICIKRGDEIIDYADTVIDFSKADKSGYLALFTIQDTGEISILSSEDGKEIDKEFVSAYADYTPRRPERNIEPDAGRDVHIAPDGDSEDDHPGEKRRSGMEPRPYVRAIPYVAIAAGAVALFIVGRLLWTKR
jgi:hypothetical protein